MSALKLLIDRLNRRVPGWGAGPNGTFTEEEATQIAIGHKGSIENYLLFLDECDAIIAAMPKQTPKDARRPHAVNWRNGALVAYLDNRWERSWTMDVFWDDCWLYGDLTRIWAPGLTGRRRSPHYTPASPEVIHRPRGVHRQSGEIIFMDIPWPEGWTLASFQTETRLYGNLNNMWPDGDTSRYY